MAVLNTSVKRDTSRIKRKGVHAKTKTSSLKTSKHYKKLYKSQGR